MMAELIVWSVLLAIIAFVIHCPIFKPWFGFRKPPGHQGHWGE